MNKFGAVPVTVDGIRFASTREARRWAELRLLERAGDIRALRRQVAIRLIGRDGPILTDTGRPRTYVADFVYEDCRLGWAEVVEDAKGHPTPEYRLKRAILAAQGVAVRET
ncbi:MAG: DUF1064 domain-containing protein [Rhodospirillales bacterium]|nr:DUF1064 domain-containing protein [Rhodospirillales bacterium]